MAREIQRCRICGNTELVPILSLGSQALTGIFPKSKTEAVPEGPLELVKCRAGGDSCGLVQLHHSFDLNELYGENYGYRSGLNPSMVRHLHGKVRKILGTVEPAPGDVILDIGSNDSTLLQGYPKKDLVLLGMDPTGRKFGKYYPAHIRLVPDFFSPEAFRSAADGRKARIVTSIAMLYDLEAPLDFMRQVRDILADDGVWVFEQSYMPSMLKVNAYDTVCHEHLEYYGLGQIAWMTRRAGLKIVQIELNDVNGGSFSVMVAKREAPFPEEASTVPGLLRREEREGLGALGPYRAFERRVREHKEKFRDFIRDSKKQDRKILGYGASTKGNVILQYCGVTDRDLPFIAEINQDKYGCFTPGTRIPIISEEEARAMKPDYFLVLPWHFKKGILEREKAYLRGGGKMVFPLPEISLEASPASRRG